MDQLTAVLTLLAGIVAILVIIAANGYFVAQEFAYMSVDRTRLRARADAGDAAARRALDITGRTSFMLSGAQLGITVTGLLVGYVAEPLVGESLGTLLGGAGVPTAVSVSVGTVLALVVATVVQMIFGELYPKNLAIASPEPLSTRLARSTRIYLAVFGWLITFFDHAANGLLRLLRIEPLHDVDTSVTAEELKRAVADSRDSGDLPVELSLLIDRVLEFPEQDVEHAMVPLSRVDAVRPESSLAELRALMARGHTRYPVVADHGAPVGVVQLVDLLRTDEPDDAPVSAVMREPLVLPTVMTLPAALEQLVGSRNQLACVVDEFGSFTGVLTVEDLAEEVVGELTDEHDVEEATESVVPAQDDTWRVDGDVHVDELQRAIGHSLPVGDWETVAGLVIAQRGALPEEGESVRVLLPDDPAELVLDEPVHRALDVTVLAVERFVPSRLLLRLVEGVDPTDPTDLADPPAEPGDPADAPAPTEQEQTR